MSYILDALKKSEQERHQEQVPNLSGTDALIYIKKKDQKPVMLYIIIGLLSLIILALVFMQWESARSNSAKSVSPTNNSNSAADETFKPDTQMFKTEAMPDLGRIPAPAAVDYSNTERENTAAAEVKPGGRDQTLAESQNVSITPNNAPGSVIEEPVIITPSKSASVQHEVHGLTSSSSKSRESEKQQDSSLLQESSSRQKVPYLEEMDLEFRRDIPDLSFNSHIYSDEPDARRVMINNLYLREGQEFLGMRLKEIKEQGIILEKDGRLFQLGVLRDWVRPN